MEQAEWLVGPSGLHGRGVFAGRDFQEGEVLEDCPVLVLAPEDLSELAGTSLSGHLFDWVDGGALALGHTSLLNHSFEPNAGYEMDYQRTRITVRTLRPIASREEITINCGGSPDAGGDLWFDASRAGRGAGRLLHQPAAGGDPGTTDESGGCPPSEGCRYPQRSRDQGGRGACHARMFQERGDLTDEPTTVLDARFSDPAGLPTSWSDTVRAIEAAELFWITTVRADGRPHVSPLVAVWLDGAIHFSTGPGEQKAVNLHANSHVILTTGCNQWDSGIDVVLQGDAVPTTDGATLQRLADAWRTKWDGRWTYRVQHGGFHHDGGTALVFTVRPTKVLAFGKGTFTHTRHQFG